MALGPDWIFAATLFTCASFCAIATYLDLKEQRIPNALVLSGFAAATSLNLAAGTGGFSFLAGVLLSLSFAFLAFLLGAWRAGDAKFFVALSAFFPLFSPQAGLSAFFGIFLWAAGFAFLYLAVRGLHTKRFALAALFALSEKDFKRRQWLIESHASALPFAPFLSLGFFANAMMPPLTGF